jgi:sulfate permease, SulP family
MVRVLPGLTKRSLLTEALAGVTLFAIAVPLNIGYAQIAGLPPTAGLYALVVPSILFALLASTRQVVASPDAAAAALVASSLVGLAGAGTEQYLAMALAQAIIGGVLFLICAFLKLGFLANFLSEPILVGFVGGLALDIMVSQIAKMLGIHLESGSEFFEKIAQLVTGIGSANGWSVLLAIGSIAILVAGRSLSRLLPWALVVLIISTIVVTVAGLEARGVAVLGPIQAGPPVVGVPNLTVGEWLQLLPSAAALTLVAIAEGLLVARSYANKRGYPDQPNRDLLAFGVANISSGFTGGFTVGSSTSRTAAVDQVGSRTQLPSIVAAVGTLLLLILGTGLLEHVPSPAIGAIVAVAVLPLVGIPRLVQIYRMSRFEFAVGAVCFLGTLVLGPIIGIVLAFVLSLLNLALRASRPAIDYLSSNDMPGGSLLPLKPGIVMAVPGVSIVRFAAPLFFANASALDDAIRKAVVAGSGSGLAHIVLDCEAVTDVDVTGAEALAELREWLATQRVQLHYSRVRPSLELLLQQLDLHDGTTVFGTNRQALDALGAPPDGELPHAGRHRG